MLPPFPMERFNKFIFIKIQLKFSCDSSTKRSEGVEGLPVGSRSAFPEQRGRHISVTLLIYNILRFHKINLEK